jgi:hypothetical protein
MPITNYIWQMQGGFSLEVPGQNPIHHATSLVPALLHAPLPIPDLLAPEVPGPGNAITVSCPDAANGVWYVWAQNGLVHWANANDVAHPSEGDNPAGAHGLNLILSQGVANFSVT